MVCQDVRVRSELIAWTTISCSLTEHAHVLSHEARLQQMRDRLAAESPEEREARLQQMRDRLAAESPEERDTRLQQMRDRLAAESPQERGQATEYEHSPTFEEREVRLQRATGCANREQSLFKQHFVQANIILQHH